MVNLVNRYQTNVLPQRKQHHRLEYSSRNAQHRTPWIIPGLTSFTDRKEWGKNINMAGKRHNVPISGKDGCENRLRTTGEVWNGFRGRGHNEFFSWQEVRSNGD